MSEILVSINCITYNHEDYIDKAIKSFLAQKTNFDFEILIHDDASTDKTQDIIKEYQKKYPNIIKPILQVKNQYSKGIKAIFNSNEKRAKGKYIALCEGDDYWTDEYKLQKQVEYMENNLQCSMCFNAAQILDINKGLIGKVKPYNKSCISPIEDIIMGGGGFCATASILYRNDLVKELPKFYLNAHVEDYPLQMLLASKGEVYYIDDFMSIYRVGDKSSWTNRNLLGENTKEKRINNIKNDIKLLNEFNEYTNCKHLDVINNTILNLEFNIALFSSNITELKNPLYTQIYKKLGVKRKVKLYTEYYCPSLYKILGGIKRRFK